MKLFRYKLLLLASGLALASLSSSFDLSATKRERQERLEQPAAKSQKTEIAPAHADKRSRNEGDDQEAFERASKKQCLDLNSFDPNSYSFEPNNGRLNHDVFGHVLEYSITNDLVTDFVLRGFQAFVIDKARKVLAESYFDLLKNGIVTLDLTREERDELMSNLKARRKNDLSDMIKSRVTRLTSLDLSCYGLVWLPDLSGLTTLKELNLRNNPGIRINPKCLPLTLEKLDLSMLAQSNWVPLDELPDLSGLTVLKELNLSGNARIIIDPARLPKTLEKLNLYRCGGIHELPDLSGFAALKELNLIDTDYVVDHTRMPVTLEKLCLSSWRRGSDLSHLIGLAELHFQGDMLYELDRDEVVRLQQSNPGLSIIVNRIRL